MPSGTSLQTLIQQIETVLIFLERPVVQQQIGALGIIIALSFVLARFLSALENRFLLPSLNRHFAPQTWLQRWLPAIGYLYWPVIAIAFIFWTSTLFVQWNIPNGILFAGSEIFLLWLGYALVSSWLYLNFNHDKVDLYQQRLIIPLLIGVASARILFAVVNVNLLAGLILVELFNTPITLGRLLSALLVFYLFLLSTWILPDILQRFIRADTPIQQGMFDSIEAIARYILTLTGLFFSFSTLGFDLSTIAFIGGGLSIGIGFGLQQVVANFVSGILLIFEQTLRPGDVVKIDDELGIVEKLNVRSTLVRTRDNVELIIPNEHLLDSVVTTYTKSDRRVRIAIDVGVSYDSDPTQIRTLLLQTAATHPHVQPNPVPTVFFNAFGASSLDFQLLVWIEKPSQILEIKSDLHFMIWETLKEHQIEIPFPQHDLNIGKGWKEIFPPSGNHQM